MPSTAQTLTELAASLNLDALSERDLKEGILVRASVQPISGDNAQALETALASFAFDGLSQRGILMCLLSFFSILGYPAQSTVTAAAAAKYSSLSDEALDQALLCILTGTAAQTSAKNLSNDIARHGYDKLSRRGTGECQLAAVQTSQGTGATLLTIASAANGNPALSDRDLSGCILTAIQ